MRDQLQCLWKPGSWLQHIVIQLYRGRYLTSGRSIESRQWREPLNRGLSKQNSHLGFIVFGLIEEKSFDLVSFKKTVLTTRIEKRKVAWIFNWSSMRHVWVAGQICLGCRRSHTYVHLQGKYVHQSKAKKAGNPWSFLLRLTLSAASPASFLSVIYGFIKAFDGIYDIHWWMEWIFIVAQYWLICICVHDLICSIWKT